MMVKKRESILSRLRPARQPMPEPSAPPMPAEKPGVQKSRQGKVNVALWVDPALRNHLHFVARKRGETLQNLILRYIEAGLVNDGETPR